MRFRKKRDLRKEKPPNQFEKVDFDAQSRNTHSADFAFTCVCMCVILALVVCGSAHACMGTHLDLWRI